MRILIRRAVLTTAVVCATVFGVTACGSDSPKPTGQQSENKSRQDTYNNLVESQPAGKMDYSPTRETKNFWIKTWDQRGKLSYVYMLNANGQAIGYFVLVGLPVSYCTSLIPPYQKIDAHRAGGGSDEIVVPAPSVDGTYSSSANCSTYYGKDAVSGAYIEYTAGNGNNVLIFDQPMPQYGDARPLGAATVETAKPK